MIGRSHNLPLLRQARQAELLAAQPQHFVSQGLCLRPNLRSLRGEGIAIGRELVATMMRRMRIETLYRPA